MESELTALIDSLRTGANRLNADLTLLEGNMGELYQASGGRPAGAQAEAAPAAPAPSAAPEPPSAPIPAPTGGGATSDAALDEEPDDGPTADAQPGPPAVTASPPAAAPAQPATPPDAAASGDGGDVEGARLIALNMALNGQSREETDRYLAENFDLSDRKSLLDEVYESVGG
jgi:hypothetical protein